MWSGGQTILIDKISKKLASTSTPPDFIEEFLYGTPHSILYWINKENPTGPNPENPETDTQYKSWEWSLQEWLKNTDFVALATSSIPIEYDDVHTEENKPVITITGFQEFEEFYALVFKISSKFPIKSAEVLINNEIYKNFLSIMNGQEISVDFLKDLYSQETNRVEIRAYDKIGNWNELFFENRPNN